MRFLIAVQVSEDLKEASPPPFPNNLFAAAHQEGTQSIPWRWALAMQSDLLT